MKLYEKEGYKRLAIALTSVAAIISYIILFSIKLPTYGYQFDSELLILPTLFTPLIAAGVFFCIKGIYWIIDGFNEKKDG